MLACTFVHNKFPHRAPEGKGILRCFLGGARDEAVLALTDEQILETVQRELKDILKLDARPIFARVYRWRGAMAQYEPGHIARVERIEKRVAEIPGLALAGNAYHGIGVPDCIRSGMEAANSLAQVSVESLSPQATISSRVEPASRVQKVKSRSTKLQPVWHCSSARQSLTGTRELHIRA